MQKIIRWYDQNILSFLATFLLVFIPLYPKWPLFDVIPGYIVRARLEDLFIAMTIVIYFVQFIRRKVQIQWNLVSVGLITYLVVGFLSVLTSIFIIQTVPLEFLHAGKTLLHWFRRIEYFSLFFIAFGAINSNRKLRIIVIMFFLTLLGIVIYGYGQKYLYWPAFSTMNREFSKGWWLYLTEHARVLSTSGGHYDLAGYLVIALSLCWSFFFGVKKLLPKIALGVLLLSAFWLLILTASRMSFVGYIIGLSIVVLLWTFKKGITWGLSRWFIAVFLSLFLMLSFGDLSDRFLHLLRIPERFSGLRDVVLKPQVAPPSKNSAFLENNIAAVTSKSDQPPTPIGKPSGASGQPSDINQNAEPSDINQNAEPLLIPTKTASGSTVLVEKTRTYSQNAVLYDLSTGIRLDATWPRAIAGFKADPILGSGYATLTKATKFEFTEAESTDNDFLRALGETGLLGFITFFGTISVMIWVAFKSLSGIRDSFLFSLVAGFVGLTVGLLVNSLLIDIFEASKVAYVFWGVSGFTMAGIYLNRDRIKADYEPLRIIIPWQSWLQKVKNELRTDRPWIILVAIFAFCLHTYKLDSPIADWHSWRQADTSAVTRNYIKNSQINWLYPVYDDLSSIASGKPNPKGLRFVEFPIYNAMTVTLKKIVPELSVEAAGHATSAIATSLSLIFIFLICRRLVSRRAGYLSALVFAVMPYNIFYGRAILPDPTMVMFSLGSICFLFSHLESKKRRPLILGVVFAAMALLVKPNAAFLLLPIVYIIIRQFGWNIKKILAIGLVFAIAVIPLFLWRVWISHFPEGVPASDWLLNGDGIRFKGAFWYWLFADRIGRLMLGYWGLGFLVLGLIRKSEGKFSYFPVLFFLSSLVYLVVIATGNVRHDYYQILLTPSLAILVGLGLDWLWNKNSQFNLWVGRFLSIVGMLFMVGFGWYFIRDFYNINHPEIVEAGREMEKASHYKALVIAPYDGDTAFLYQTNRQGWPIMQGSIDDMIKLGADYYVSVKFDQLTKDLIEEAQKTKKPLKGYKIIKLTPTYTIIQLVPDKALPKD